VAQQNIKHIKSANKLAQIMYSSFSLDEIYNAAASGMSMDVHCESETGVPKELTVEEFDKKILNIPSPSKERILSFQKKCNLFNNEYIRKHGTHYDNYKGMTETEKYAYMHFSSIWYSN